MNMPDQSLEQKSSMTPKDLTNINTRVKGLSGSSVPVLPGQGVVASIARLEVPSVHLLLEVFLSVMDTT